MAKTMTITTFAPATDERDARLNYRSFRAPACVVDIDTFELDVQNNVNYFQLDKLTTARNNVARRLDALEVDSKSYDKVASRLDKCEYALTAFEELNTCGHSFVRGFPCLIAWTICKSIRKGATKDDVRDLRYSYELLSAIYDASELDTDALNNLKLSVIGFIRYHASNMAEYGKQFDIRFTDAQARELVHFANASRLNWTKATISERSATDNDIIEHCVMSCLRKTFGWDVAGYVPPVGYRAILN